jgi:CheY-like chemotaxis protein
MMPKMDGVELAMAIRTLPRIAKYLFSRAGSFGGIDQESKWKRLRVYVRAKTDSSNEDG